MLAIIGGTGLTKLSNLQVTHRQVMRTPYGEPSGALTFGLINQHEVMFIARHGYGHTLPPHLVNYRANMWALQEQGATRVVSVASVGGIRADLLPGMIVVPDQILDYTQGRAYTYFDTRDKKVTHIDFTLPYCVNMRSRLLEAAQQANEKFFDGGVYAATQGPRLETAAEINRYERDGADMVGMTGMPEASLAKELGLSYATIAVVVNYAAGRGDSRDGINLEKISAVTQPALARVKKVIERLVENDAE
ncbi:MAG: S-methyl-5'-thioinosine phosphorylase [Gallionellaceae bacterium]